VPPVPPQPPAPPAGSPYFFITILNKDANNEIHVKRDSTAQVQVGVDEYLFSGPIFFTTSALIRGMSGSFIPQSPANGYGTILFLVVDITVPLGTYFVTVTGTAGSLQSSATFKLVVTS
jgi:hypothetical protein